MDSLVGSIGLTPRPRETTKGDRLAVKTTWVGSFQAIRGVVGAFLQECSDHPVNEARVYERAIGGDSHDKVGVVSLSCQIVTIEHIVFVPAKPAHAEAVTLRDDRIVFGGRGGGNHHLIDQGSSLCAP